MVGSLVQNELQGCGRKSSWNNSVYCFTVWIFAGQVLILGVPEYGEVPIFETDVG
jgi:hypothetical protein